MSALVDDILSIFLTQKDKNNEYTLRYSAWQTGNKRFAEEMLSFFPTRKNEKTYSRTDAQVAATTTNDTHLAQWRAKYGFLPHNTHALIDAWLVEQVAVGDDDALQAAACIVFASRSTVKLAPEIVEWHGILFAAWRETEKCLKPRLVPLLFESVTREQYTAMARVLPGANEWNRFKSIDTLFDRLGLPEFARKANLPRPMLVGLMDRAMSYNSKLKPLLARLPRGRLDLFNLVLGHVSKSFLVWTYMGMLIRDADVEAPPLSEAMLFRDEAISESVPSTPISSTPQRSSSTAAWRTPFADKENIQLRAQLVEKDDEIAQLKKEIAKLREQLASVTPKRDTRDTLSSPFSLSPLSPLNLTE